jgi:hypothetical protein
MFLNFKGMGTVVLNFGVNKNAVAESGHSIPAQ